MDILMTLGSFVALMAILFAVPDPSKAVKAETRTSPQQIPQAA